MKPAIAWILAVLLLAGSTACERIPRYEGEVSEGKPAGGAGVSADSNQDYEEVTQLPEGEAMLASLEQLAAYLRQPQSTVDMYDPQAEDFWLILSLVTYAAHPDWESSFGTLDLKENVVKEIADIFSRAAARTRFCRLPGQTVLPNTTRRRAFTSFSPSPSARGIHFSWQWRI